MEWKPLWHYHLVHFGREFGDLNNLTQRLHLLASIGGNQIRLKLDNRYNKGKMHIESIELGVVDAENNPCGPTKKVTVDGREEAVLEENETRYTDTVDFEIAPGQYLDVYIHFKEVVGICAICQTWSAKTWQSEVYPGGDKTDVKSITDMFMPLRRDVHRPTAVVGISHIDVMTDSGVRNIAMFGDSITHMSYYYDPLLERVLKEHPGKAVLTNEGIGGNRLCYDAVYIAAFKARATLFGPAGYARFEENVYTDMNPDVVLLLEGINDCSHGYQHSEDVPTLEEFISRCEEVIACAHSHGSKIYLGTIMPASSFDKEPWYNKYNDLRLAINEWIRTQTVADGIIDFDVVMRDPDNTNSPIAEFMMEDGLHPDTKGGEKMAETVPLGMILGDA